DKLLGMPSEVNAFYSEGRTLFLQKMDAVLDNIVQLISAALTEAKAAVAEGRQQINDYVAGLPQELQEIGAEAAQEVQGRFDELEQQIDDKQGELIESLARQYTEQVQALDARIEELKAANEGLVQQAFNKIAGVIRTINELKDMLLNVLARAAGVIKAILADPIGFLANLINGIKAGLNQFISNIGDHLQKGFIGWLTGSLAEAGIELPETFDMAGIFSLVMQVLGISFEKIIGRVSEVLGIDIMSIWDKIQQIIEIYQTEGLPGLARYGLEQVIGEENVAALIQVVNIIKMAMEGNLAALWDLVQTHLAGLKELIFDQIQDFLITKVIKAGIMWIISMLNPAGAFIRACKAIYDIVMFFIERGSQIMSLVEAIIGAVSSIVSGSIGAMAQAVENALARAIPVAISFLASLLGLGGISDKVREVIEKVRGMVDRALDAVLNSRPVQAVAGFIRTIIAKMGQLVERGKEAVANAFGGGSSADDDEPAAAGPGAAAPGSAPAGTAGDAADSEQSLDVKEKARQKVAERAKQPFQKREELDQVINEIRQELAPEGLKALQLDPKEGQPGKFDVIATASPPTDVGDATVDTSGKYPTGEDPTTRTITQLWKDCSADTTLAGESPADKVERVRLAEATLTVKLGNSAAIQAILAHERGQKPRPFVSVSTEDAHPAAHTTE
ncbi:MAG: hypothetical protein KDE59_27305, partial [Anaerolineales bacterium]|nr:hypothetical protein [Anaerolineales bacterium]